MINLKKKQKQLLEITEKAVISATGRCITYKGRMYLLTYEVHRSLNSKHSWYIKVPKLAYCPTAYAEIVYLGLDMCKSDKDLSLLLSCIGASLADLKDLEEYSNE
jgi:hypothetical protein